MEIHNIEELITPLLQNGRTFQSSEVQALLAPGENYGSTMLALKIKMLNEENQEELVSCVAKLVPPSEFIWKLFNIPVTFKKEIRIYKIVIPVLKDFGRRHGVENLLPFFTECIGARISLNPEGNEVDHDAAIILKDLKTDGYIVCDRFTGFNEETTKLLLKDLAVMHATSIAFKLENPKEFKEKIMPFCKRPVDMEFSEDIMQKNFEQILKAIARDKECLPLMDRVMKKIALMKNEMFKTIAPREPFATTVHMDFWTNNVMVKFENDKPTSSKFLDFQCIEYTNPANDVIFLLYTSVEFELLTKIDEFIEYYFENFISILKVLHCDTSQFGFEVFQEELNHSAVNMEFGQIMYMLKPIFTLKNKAKNLSDMKDEGDILLDTHALHENYYPRLQFVVKDFAKRNWI